MANPTSPSQRAARDDERPPPYSAVPRKPGASDPCPEVAFKKSNGAAPSDSRIKFSKKSGKSKRAEEEEKLRRPSGAPEPPPKPVT